MLSVRGGALQCEQVLEFVVGVEDLLSGVVHDARAAVHQPPPCMELRRPQQGLQVVLRSRVEGDVA